MDFQGASEVVCICVLGVWMCVFLGKWARESKEQLLTLEGSLSVPGSWPAAGLGRDVSASHHQNPTSDKMAQDEKDCSIIMFDQRIKTRSLSKPQK